jgi:hypothetical protein
MDKIPQTIGGKVGGSLAESKMRQSSLTVFLTPGQVRRQTRPERAGQSVVSSAVEAGGSEDYRNLAMPQSRRKRCSRDRSSR